MQQGNVRIKSPVLRAMSLAIWIFCDGVFRIKRTRHLLKSGIVVELFFRSDRRIVRVIFWRGRSQRKLTSDDTMAGIEIPIRRAEWRRLCEHLAHGSGEARLLNCWWSVSEDGSYFARHDTERFYFSSEDLSGLRNLMKKTSTVRMVQYG